MRSRMQSRLSLKKVQNLTMLLSRISDKNRGCEVSQYTTELRKRDSKKKRSLISPCHNIC